MGTETPHFKEGRNLSRKKNPPSNNSKGPGGKKTVNRTKDFRHVVFETENS